MWDSEFQSSLKVTTKLCLESVIHIISYIVILKVPIIDALKEQRCALGLNQVLDLTFLFLSKLPVPKTIICWPSLHTFLLPYPYCCMWTKIIGTTVARKTLIANARSQRETQSLASETNKDVSFCCSWLACSSLFVFWQLAVALATWLPPAALLQSETQC